jgi:hypothetical protein
MIYKCLFMSKQNKKYSLCPNLLVILGVHTGIMSEKRWVHRKQSGDRDKDVLGKEKCVK